MKHYEISVIASRRSRPVDLETASQRVGLHPDLIRELVGVHLVEATRDLSFDEAAMNRLRQIASLRAGEKMSFRTIRMVLRLVDRLEEAENELRYLREMSR